MRAENGRLGGGLRPYSYYPVSCGTLNPKDATAHQFVHQPYRLARPMLWKDRRLAPVGWEEAYDFVAGELGRLREEHGPGAIGLISSSRATEILDQITDHVSDVIAPMPQFGSTLTAWRLYESLV